MANSSQSKQKSSRHSSKASQPRFHPRYPTEPLIHKPTYRGFILDYQREGPYLQKGLDKLDLMLKKQLKAYPSMAAVRFEYPIPNALQIKARNHPYAKKIAQAINQHLTCYPETPDGKNLQAYLNRATVIYSIHGNAKIKQMYWQFVVLVNAQLFQSPNGSHQNLNLQPDYTAILDCVYPAIAAVTKQTLETVLYEIEINSTHWLPLSTLHYLRTGAVRDLYKHTAYLAEAMGKPSEVHFKLIDAVKI